MCTDGRASRHIILYTPQLNRNRNFNPKKFSNAHRHLLHHMSTERKMENIPNPECSVIVYSRYIC